MPQFRKTTSAYQLYLFGEIKQEGTGLCPVHLLPLGVKPSSLKGYISNRL